MEGDIGSNILQHWEMLARNKEIKSSELDSNSIFCIKNVSCFSFFLFSLLIIQLLNVEIVFPKRDSVPNFHFTW